MFRLRFSVRTLLLITTFVGLSILPIMKVCSLLARKNVRPHSQIIMGGVTPRIIVQQEEEQKVIGDFGDEED